MHDHNFVWRKISAKIHLPLNWPFDKILDFKIVWDCGVRDSYGQGKQDSHAQKNYPLSALLQLTFCLPVPMYLNKQKIRIVLKSNKGPKYSSIKSFEDQKKSESCHDCHTQIKSVLEKLPALIATLMMFR